MVHVLLPLTIQFENLLVFIGIWSGIRDIVGIGYGKMYNKHNITPDPQSMNRLDYTREESAIGHICMHSTPHQMVCWAILWCCFQVICLIYWCCWNRIRPECAVTNYEQTHWLNCERLLAPQQWNNIIWQVLHIFVRISIVCSIKYILWGHLKHLLKHMQQTQK